jgi:hypothetical protein
MAQKTRFGSTLVMLPLAAAFGLVACDTSASDVSDPTTSESALGARDDAAGGAAADEAAGGAPAEEARPERPRPPVGGAPARDDADDADDADDDVDEAADEAADEAERGERPHRGGAGDHAEGDDGACDRPAREGDREPPPPPPEGAYGREPPPPPPSAEGDAPLCPPEVFEACHAEARAAGEACAAEGGDRATCGEAAHSAGRACVEAECGPPPEGADGREPPPPPPR